MPEEDPFYDKYGTNRKPSRTLEICGWCLVFYLLVVLLHGCLLGG